MQTSIAKCTPCYVDSRDVELKKEEWERIQKAGHFQVKKVWNAKQEVWERTIINNYTIMLRCYARDGLSFVHLCNISSYTQEIWVNMHIFMSGFYAKSVGTPFPLVPAPPSPLVDPQAGKKFAKLYQIQLKWRLIVIWPCYDSCAKIGKRHRRGLAKGLKVQRQFPCLIPFAWKHKS